MKRIVCLLLAILMVFGSVAALASCGECTDHVDANHDGKCDNDGCEATVTVTHTDADENGKCDVCDADMPAAEEPECTEHVDEDVDFKCDACGAEIVEVVNYPWDSQTLLFELSENTNVQQLPSGSKRYLAGEDTSATEAIDGEVAARNAAAEAATKVDITYTYLDDSSAYTWGKMVSIIETTVKNGVNPESPDMYVNFIYDLSYATLKGCFANLLGKTRGAGELKGLNYFEFAKEDYKPDKNQEGFFYDYMNNITTDKSKMFLLASDYTIDVIRAYFMVPVNVSLAETVIEDVIGDVNKDTKFDIYDLYALVEEGKWTYKVLMDFAAEIYTPAADNQGSATLSDEILGFAMTRNGFGESGFLYSTNVSIIKEGVDSFGRDTYVIPDTNEQFFELTDALATLSKAPGVWPAAKLGKEFPEWGAQTYHQIRLRFSQDHVLFGGVDLLGALEDENIQAMKETSGFGILPVPMYKAGVGYNVHIHNVGRVATISAITLKFAECTAFLNYQSTHSAEILSSYYDYKLLFDVAAGDNGTKSMLKLLNDSVRSSFDKVTDDIIRHFHGMTTDQLKELLNGQTDPRWHAIISYANWDVDMRAMYDKFVETRRAALATFLEQYRKLAD